MNAPSKSLTLFLALAGSLSLAACGSDKNGAPPASQGDPLPVVDKATAEPAVPRPPGLRTAAQCEGELLPWLTGNGMTHGTAVAEETDQGCEMTFDVGGQDMGAIKAAMSESLVREGYVLSGTEPARRGERLSFTHPGGEQVSLLLRSREAVKVRTPEATGQAYVHWYRELQAP